MSSFERLATELMRRHAPEGFGIDFASFARKGNLVILSGALPRTLHFGVKRGLPGGALLLHGHGRGGSFFSAMSGTGREGEWVISMYD